MAFTTGNEAGDCYQQQEMEALDFISIICLISKKRISYELIRSNSYVFWTIMNSGRILNRENKIVYLCQFGFILVKKDGFNRNKTALGYNIIIEISVFL